MDAKAFEEWSREEQNKYMSLLETELEMCREIAAKPKVVNAEAHVVVRFAGTSPIIEEG
jgi:hypothetical protein